MITLWSHLNHTMTTSWSHHDQTMTAPWPNYNHTTTTPWRHDHPQPHHDHTQTTPPPHQNHITTTPWTHHQKNMLWPHQKHTTRPPLPRCEGAKVQRWQQKGYKQARKQAEWHGHFLSCLSQLKIFIETEMFDQDNLVNGDNSGKQKLFWHNNLCT